MADQTLILRVTLDEGKTEDQLRQLVLDIEATKKAQADLTAARKAGQVSDEQYAQQVVKLKGELQDQTRAYTAQAKNLELYRTAVNATEDSYEGLQSQLSLAQRQYKLLDGSANNSSTAAQHLTKTIDGLRNTLKSTDAQQSLFARNVGNYGTSLADADAKTNLFGGHVGQLKERFTQAKQGIELTKGGLTGLKGALAATGIGLFVLALGALVEYFTKTDEGAEELAAIMGGLKGVVGALSGVVIDLGKGLVRVFTDPKESAKDLVEFLGNQVTNRIKAFGVLWDAIRNGNTKQLIDGAVQLSTGITNATAKTERFATELKRAAAAGYEISRAQDALDDGQRASIVLTERQRNEVDKLVISAKDRTLTEQQRLANLDKAGRIETEILQRTTRLANEKLRIQQLQNKEAERTGKISDEQREAAEQAQADVVRLAGQSATLQQSIQNRRSVLIQQETALQVAAAKQRAKDAVAAKQTENELLLLAVAKGSAAELVLKQRGIDLAADMALAGEKKTQAQIKLIRAQAEGDKLEMTRTFQEKALADAAKATAATAAEAKREYDEAVVLLGNYLDEKRAQIERDYAAGRLSEGQYQKQLNAIEKAGVDAQTVINKDYQKDNGKNLRAAADFEIKEAKRVRDEKKKIEDTKQEIQDASFAAAAAASDATIALFGEESAAGEAALFIKKSLAIAEIGINLQKQLAANAVAGAKISAEAPPVTIPLGIAYTVATDALAIATSAGAAAKILGFRDGGVLVGPSHDQGGIPFTVAGRPGFEAEGGETILTRGVWQNELLRPLVSAINVIGGGRPLVPSTYMAAGGIASPLVRDQLRGEAQGISAKAVGVAVAKALQKNPPVTRWVDYKAADKRAGFTESQANS